MDEGRAPLRLTEVTLRGFKAACAPPPIPLRPFNLLIGRNGSGKSTLVEALQWVDTATRKDIYAACDPFNGYAHLVNKRSDAGSFEILLSFGSPTCAVPVRESIRTRVEHGGRPVIDRESLDIEKYQLKAIRNDGRLGDFWGNDDLKLLMEGAAHSDLYADWLRHRRDAVFLRLIPSQLSMPAPLFRKSHDPILDESGRLLPVLLSEVLADSDRRSELTGRLGDLLPWVRDVEVLGATPSRDLPAYYALHEQLPGGADSRTWPIPAWMLSEGTRRVTAILALLLRDPAPSLIAIEELENGLDPWTVRGLLRELQSAADRGIQIIATTHSPWVLDDAPPESVLQVRRTADDIVYERFTDRPAVRAYHPSVPMGTRYVNEAE